MKPFLLLATRAEDAVAEEEYQSFLAAGGLAPDQLHRLRLERAPLGDIHLSDYSGIIVGGSPFNASDPADEKSLTQRRVESELAPLIDRVVAEDFPFFGACYGVGLLAGHLDGLVDTTWSEGVGPVRVALTNDGAADQLFGTLRSDFDAYVGHKEACTVLPSGATLMASGTACPVQAFRVGRNVYATQFHPELTAEGIIGRIRAYQTNGYFPPEQMDDVIAAIEASTVTEPRRLVRAFVETFSRS
jgi:GMP synthase (glutamine-hydrolysing)